MLGNFVYSNPTKLYFGKDSLDNLTSALNGYSRIMLVYGGGSIKKNGLYDKIVKILRDSGREIIEDGGVMPNPTVEKLYEGSKIARDNNVDFNGIIYYLIGMYLVNAAVENIIMAPGSFCNAEHIIFSCCNERTENSIRIISEQINIFFRTIVAALNGQPDFLLKPR